MGGVNLHRNTGVLSGSYVTKLLKAMSARVWLFLSGFPTKGRNVNINGRTLIFIGRKVCRTHCWENLSLSSEFYSIGYIIMCARRGRTSRGGETSANNQQPHKEDGSINYLNAYPRSIDHFIESSEILLSPYEF